jgi:putative ABC transport system permease protein
MRIGEIIRSVLLSVRSNRFRAILTSLGIIIGTFTITMVVGIGKASQQAVNDEYKRLSVNSITISLNSRGFGTTTKTATKEQMLNMSKELDDVQSVGVSIRSNSTVAYSDLSETVAVMGTNEAYANITNLVSLYGDYFTDDDSTQRNRVVVLGYNVANYLFNNDLSQAVGSTIYVKGVTFQVVGVLSRIGGAGGMTSTSGGGASGSVSSSSDDMAFIPYDVALKYAAASSSNRNARMAAATTSSATPSYYALANDLSSVKPAIKEIQQYLADITSSSTTYSVSDAGSALASAQKSSTTMSSLLIAVAAIVLIVSGIGIMNVMMVAVKERTREIGILKAVGASRRTILMEFLFEAVLISIIGGLIGIVLSVFAPNVLSYFGISYLASADGIALGLVFSVLTGIFFGYYPAVKASKLKPIDALNYE